MRGTLNYLRFAAPLGCLLLLTACEVSAGDFDAGSVPHWEAGAGQHDARVLGPDSGSILANAGLCEPDTAELCETGCLSYQHVFAATELGPGTRFVGAAAGGVILAERPNDDSIPEPLVLVPAYEGSFFQWFTIPVAAGAGGGLQARGVIGSYPSLMPSGELGSYEGVVGHHLLTLLCAGAQCALYGVPLDADAPPELLPVPGGELPTGFEPRLLIDQLWGAGTDRKHVCVVGDGIVCFDGEQWLEALPAGEGSAINDLQVEGALSPISLAYAVGDGGRFLVHDGLVWRDYSHLTGRDLLVAQRDYAFAAGGRNGELVVGLPGPELAPWTIRPEQWTTLSVGPMDVAHVRWSLAANCFFKALLPSGCVLQMTTECWPSSIPENYCIEPTALPGRPVGMTFAWQSPCTYWVMVTDVGAFGCGDGCAE